MQKVEILKQALEIIEDKRNKALSVSESNLEKAKLSPEFLTLYKRINELKFEIPKAEFSGLNNINVLKQELKDVSDKIEKVILNLGFTKQDFVPQFECKICKDTGFVKGKKCVCLKKEISKILLQFSGLNLDNLPTFENNNFDVFEKSKQEEIKLLYDKMKQYTTDLKKTTKKSVLFMGNVGVGKTHLAKTMVKNAIDNGYYTVFTTAFMLNENLLKSHIASVQEKDGILEKYLNCDMLVIDDLGTEPRYKNVTEEYLYLIINQRLVEGKNTIITTNLDLEQIREVYGDRIFSRISNKQSGLVIQLNGKDLRLNIE